jgi:acetyl-CoA carboxylase/biotin carboxylase 1
VGPSGGLHEFADSQFGHIFSHGISREEARKELVIALKELSIRGDISTPIQYVRSLLEGTTFKKNEITTAWLDGLIAKDVQVEQKLDSWLVVICGVVCKVFSLACKRRQSYASLLNRGQIPPKSLLKSEDRIELIYMNIKYRFIVYQCGRESFVLELEGKEGRVEVEVRSLGDGGLLILLNGKSYVSYAQETNTGLKLLLDGRTCLFTNEYDPTQLRTSTAGKLVRYLVENGSHVKAGTSYAEIEVMKVWKSFSMREFQRSSCL